MLFIADESCPFPPSMMTSWGNFWFSLLFSISSVYNSHWGESSAPDTVLILNVDNQPYWSCIFKYDTSCNRICSIMLELSKHSIWAVVQTMQIIFKLFKVFPGRACGECSFFSSSVPVYSRLRCAQRVQEASVSHSFWHCILYFIKKNIRFECKIISANRFGASALFQLWQNQNRFLSLQPYF